ncbi:UNKNOWN [Stylonychia lemnae]|uniref:Uncharacterized protein n=1 Tax=Stylonychia lemnae TaxID=5949 RepID=A0A078B4H5_STYLE|nr:UNKNOWN [Stylonychia lemnae]|eukprot:CDW88383.1 UNKNOWN [Stylonychia lemnae]
MLSDSFSCKSSNQTHISQNSQTWLNLETQSLRNEVSELQRMLDEINQNSRISQDQQSSHRSYQHILQQINPQIQSTKASSSLKQSQQSNQETEIVSQVLKSKSSMNVQQKEYKRINEGGNAISLVNRNRQQILERSNQKDKSNHNIQTPNNNQPSFLNNSRNQNNDTTLSLQQSCSSLGRISNLKQPTKISKNSSLSTEKGFTDSLIGKKNLRQINQHQLITKPVLQQKKNSTQILRKESKENINHETSLDTSIQNKYNRIIQNLDNEINNDKISSVLKQKPQNNASIVFDDSLLNKTLQNDTNDDINPHLQQLMESPDADKKDIESELLRMRETLEFIRQQEMMLLNRISQDNTATTSANDDRLNKARDQPQKEMQLEESMVHIQDTDNEQNFNMSGTQPQIALIHQIQNQKPQRQHHRRISKNSFGCRSLQDLKNSFKDECSLFSYQESSGNTKHSLPQAIFGMQNGSNNISNTNINLSVLDNNPDFSISTPRTNGNTQNNQEDSSMTQVFNPINPAQTPFFNKNMHLKKDSLLNNQELYRDPILSKLNDNNDIKLRDGSRTQRIQIIEFQDDNLENEDYVEGLYEPQMIIKKEQHAFNTSRNMKRPQIDTNNGVERTIQGTIQTTPKSNNIKSVYTSQRSNGKNNSQGGPNAANANGSIGNTLSSKARARNQFDYSKISKHQSIAKIFESRRISKKQQSIEKGPGGVNKTYLAGINNNTQVNLVNYEFDMRRQSTQNIINNMSSCEEKIIQSRNINIQSSNQKFQRTQQLPLQQNYFQQTRDSQSKEKLQSSNNQQNGLKNQREIQTVQNSATQLSSSRLHLETSQNKQFNDTIQFSHNLIGSQSSRNINLPKSNTQKLVLTQNQQILNKDHSFVRQRKLEIEQEKQQKLAQKIQQKDQKIISLVQKKAEEDKSRREPHSIYEKTMRMKQRADEKKQIQQQSNMNLTNDNNPKLLSNNKSQRDFNQTEGSNSKTPRKLVRNDHQYGAMPNKSFVYQRDAKTASRSVSPKKIMSVNRQEILQQQVLKQTPMNQSVFQNSSTSTANFLQPTIVPHSRQNCENCQRLFSKGLSSNYCPMHLNLNIQNKGTTNGALNPLAKHSQQASNVSIGDLLNGSSESCYLGITDPNISITTFGGRVM